MSPRLGTELIHLDEVVVIMVVGEIDASTAPLLRDACCEAAAVSHRLVIDAAGVTFMDCSALHVLIATQQREDTTTVVLRNASGQVWRLLEITGLATRFQEPVSPHAHDEPGATTEAADHRVELPE